MELERNLSRGCYTVVGNETSLDVIWQSRYLVEAASSNEEELLPSSGGSWRVDRKRSEMTSVSIVNLILHTP